MNENNALANLAEQTLANIEAVTEEAKEPTYTLEEAKEKFGLLTKSEANEKAYKLVSKVVEVFNKIKNDDTAVAIFNHKSYQDIEDSNLEDMDIEDFIKTCKQIVHDHEWNRLDIPEDLVDEYDLEEYFVDNARDFWDNNVSYGSLDRSDVLSAYLESGELDLDDAIECFEIED